MSLQYDDGKKAINTFLDQLRMNEEDSGVLSDPEYVQALFQGLVDACEDEGLNTTVILQKIIEENES